MTYSKHPLIQHVWDLKHAGLQDECRENHVEVRIKQSTAVKYVFYSLNSRSKIKNLNKS